MWEGAHLVVFLLVAIGGGEFRWLLVSVSLVATSIVLVVVIVVVVFSSQTASSV